MIGPLVLVSAGNTIGLNGRGARPNLLCKLNMQLQEIWIGFQAIFVLLVSKYFPFEASKTCVHYYFFLFGGQKGCNDVTHIIKKVIFFICHMILDS